jgi:hypothetical protein
MLITAASLCFAAMPAMATDFEFTGDDDGWGDGESWNDSLNWTPGGGPPRAGDHAMIPDGKHCYVQQNWQWAKTIEIEDGATLTIRNGYWLRIGSTEEDTTSIINGELNFEGTTSVLQVEQSHETQDARKVTLDSTDQDGGLIIARGADDHSGGIDWNH